MKAGWGTADASARRTLWTALILLVVVSTCLLSGLYDEAQARVQTQGSYALRTGPHPSGLAMWSEDGEQWRVE